MGVTRWSVGRVAGPRAAPRHDQAGDGHDPQGHVGEMPAPLGHAEHSEGDHGRARRTAAPREPLKGAPAPVKASWQRRPAPPTLAAHQEAASDASNAGPVSKPPPDAHHGRI